MVYVIQVTVTPCEQDQDGNFILVLIASFMDSEVMHVRKQIGLKAYGEVRVYLNTFFNLVCGRWSSDQFHLWILDVCLLFACF